MPVGNGAGNVAGFQFIEFPSEWGGSLTTRSASNGQGFQFIEFPSEWGVEFHQSIAPFFWEFPIY